MPTLEELENKIEDLKKRFDELPENDNKELKELLKQHDHRGIDTAPLIAQLTKTEKTDLTDSGVTTLHKHDIVEDTTPQLGGDLDLNSKNIDFPSVANVSDCKDEDDMASDSATMLATQQSIKKYVDDSGSGRAIYGDGSDGDVTISGNTTLTSDKYYDNLTINDGITLTTAGYRVFVKGTLTITTTGKISNGGTAGGAGENGKDGVGGAGSPMTGGAFGTAGTGGVGNYFTAGVDGKNGGVGGDASATGGVAGTAGVDGESVSPRALGNAGRAGGDGGTGGTAQQVGGTGGTGGSAGGVTSSSILQKPFAVPMSIVVRDLDSSSVYQPYQAGAGCGGGGGGGGGDGETARGGGSGAGGGGSGGNGGFLGVYAKNIVLTSGQGLIEANGGNGGNGGDGGDGFDGEVSGGGGGAGGGAGGNGGIVILVYSTWSGVGSPTANVDAVGGSRGLGGTAGISYNGVEADAQDGDNGITGYLGLEIIIQN